jgi:hypothetical protein
MPQQFYYQQYCNTSATTNSTQYVPMWGSWQNNATIIQTNGWYQNQSAYTPIITSTGADQVWYTWVTMGNGTMTTSPNYTYHQETPEEIEARREERAREAEERVAARTRARVLLEDFLDDEQKEELNYHSRFHVTGSKGRRYCIRTSGQQGNVDLLKPDGGVQATLCCHPRGYLPDGDAWLMQMVEIRHDEEHFLRTANVHRGSLPVAA